MIVCAGGKGAQHPFLQHAAPEAPRLTGSWSSRREGHRVSDLEGGRPWGCKESDMTDRLSAAQHSTGKHEAFYRLYSFHGSGFSSN